MLFPKITVTCFAKLEGNQSIHLVLVMQDNLAVKTISIIDDTVIPFLERLSPILRIRGKKTTTQKLQ